MFWTHNGVHWLRSRWASVHMVVLRSHSAYVQGGPGVRSPLRESRVLGYRPPLRIAGSWSLAPSSRGVQGPCGTVPSRQGTYGYPGAQSLPRVRTPPGTTKKNTVWFCFHFGSSVVRHQSPVTFVTLSERVAIKR